MTWGPTTTCWPSSSRVFCFQDMLSLFVALPEPCLEKQYWFIFFFSLFALLFRHCLLSLPAFDGLGVVPGSLHGDEGLGAAVLAMGGYRPPYGTAQPSSCLLPRPRLLLCLFVRLPFICCLVLAHNLIPQRRQAWVAQPTEPRTRANNCITPYSDLWSIKKAQRLL